MIPGSASTEFFGAAGAAAAGGGAYEISRSLRFEAGDSANLSRTPSVSGNRKTWTWSSWIKGPFNDPSFPRILNVEGPSAGFRTVVRLTDGSQLQAYSYDGSDFQWLLTTAQLFRDPSAWRHLLIAFDTTQATSSNRVKIYVNGVQVTTFATATYPSLNFEAAVNHTSPHTIGGGQPLSAYLAEIFLLDGIATDPSSFTTTDATTGQLIPTEYIGSYGGVSVATATGALPIFNTTDTYGAVKGTGTRTDSNASSLSLCVPMGTSGGLSLTDEQPTGRTSSSSTLTNTSVTSSTSVSKFYGGSANFNGTTSKLTTSATSDFLFGTGDFTVEGWFNLAVTRDYPFILEIGAHAAADSIAFMVNSTGYGTCLYSGAFYGSGAFVQLNQWSHIAWVRRSGTLYIYINGTLSSTAAFTNNLTGTTNGVVIGTTHSGSSIYFFEGHIQDLRVYKGLGKYSSNFSVVTPSNGFHLPFSDNATTAALGTDTSGNGNTWTVNNFSVTAGVNNDSTTDTPTSYGTDTGVGGEVRGNYCTGNPLAIGGGTLSNGNLDYVRVSDPSGNTIGKVMTTFATNSGKWYFEFTIATASTSSAAIGVTSNIQGSIANVGGTNYVGIGAYEYVWRAMGSTINNGNFASYGTAASNGDVIACAFDVDAGKIWFGKNGTWFNSSSPSAGTSPAFSGFTGTVMPIFGLGTASAGFDGNGSINFGQRAFAYTAPSGFKALVDTNLPAPVVAKPNTVMDVKLYTGNGGTQSITGLNFNPDFVWLKSRSSGSYSHNLYDAVRGATKILYSDSTSSENTDANGLTAFNSDGFSLGSTAATNASSTTYVGWAWDAGTSTVTNTAGSITSQVRANPSAGFSVCTFTGNSTGGATVGHGLGVTPQFILVKSRSNSYNWCVYAKAANSGNGQNGGFYLNRTDAWTSDSGFWNNTAANSTTFTLGAGFAVNDSGATYVAYAFAPVAGYSSFGSYVGSSDNPFVYLGFRPKWIMIKCTSTDNGYTFWDINDATRSPYNTLSNTLCANLSDAEDSANIGNPYIDFLSNGFKLRTGGSAKNISGQTYVYSAFSESPFQYARAR
jgi:hypothetical protein